MAGKPSNTPCAQRDARLIKAYHAGATGEQLARRFRIPENTVRSIIHRRGASLPPAERHARSSEACRRRWEDPVFRARHAESVRRAVSVWFDCPPEARGAYETLRMYYPAGEARAIVERELGL